MTKTLTGPNGIRIVLDSRQVFPDDPGAGTPALVHVGKNTATYWCALDTKEVDYHDLDNAQYRWLYNQFDAVSDFVAKYS